MRGRVSVRRLGAFGALLAGGLAAAWHAFPVEDVKAAGKCPPAQEGLYYCMVQKAWMPAIMEVLLVATAAYLLYEFAINSPKTWRAVRAERKQRKMATPPPFERDNTLLAASWGNKYDDPARPKPRREVEGRPVVVPVPVMVAAPEPAPEPEPDRDDPERRRKLERIALALDLADQLGLQRQPGTDGIRRRSAA